MKALAAIALTLAIAPPAAADTVARRTPVVGPVLAGDVVAWGEESRGASRVMVGAPGREPLLVYRARPATARRTERSFSGMHSAFSASATAFAGLITTSTVTFEESDSVTSATTDGAVGGPFRGPVATFAGCIPRRGDLGCGEPCPFIHGVDVDGSRTAVSMSTRSRCGADEAPRHTVVVYDGASTTVLTGGEGFLISDVELAGRYVAWVEDKLRGSERLIVYDLVTGAPVLQLSNRDFDARGIWDIALGEDGTVAATFSGRRDLRGARLGLVAVGAPGVRLVARHTGYDVKMAGGRLLYDHVISARRNRSDLILHSLADGRRQVLARFRERRRRAGDFDLDTRRVTWGEVPTRRGYDLVPRGPGRIVLRSL